MAPMLLLGALLTGAVVFGMSLWGREPAQVAPPSSHASPIAPGPRVPMPTGNIPGWRQVFADDFTGHRLNPAKWRTYWGQPGGDPGGFFSPRHISVSNGMLVISGYRDRTLGGRWATGGVSSSPGLIQTYGKYEVRFRLDPGVGVGHALLLAAANGQWPPELDFSEDDASNRVRTLTTLHYAPHDSKISRLLTVNLTQWHTLGVQWTPGRLVYTIDGRDWATVASTHVPSIPMVMDIQTQTWPCGHSWAQCPNASTPSVVRIYVDWVVAYARSAQAGA
jgi:beta-glucanase (GH16 family)